jgi:hypothetical protein
MDAETTLATCTAERDAALMMAKRTMKLGSTMGEDKGYDTADFVKHLRDLKMTPHIAQKKNSALDGSTTRHAGYTASLKKRKLVKETSG